MMPAMCADVGNPAECLGGELHLERWAAANGLVPGSLAIGPQNSWIPLLQVPGEPSHRIDLLRFACYQIFQEY